RRSCCSRSTSTRCTPRPCASARPRLRSSRPPRATWPRRSRPATPDTAVDGLPMTATPGSTRLAVLGAGSWGTALATLTARNGLATTLWGRDAVVVEAIDQRHENPRYLPGIPLPGNLRATTDLA